MVDHDEKLLADIRAAEKAVADLCKRAREDAGSDQVSNRRAALAKTSLEAGFRSLVDAVTRTAGAFD